MKKKLKFVIKNIKEKFIIFKEKIIFLKGKIIIFITRNKNHLIELDHQIVEVSKSITYSEVEYFIYL